jgi:hypothetical protein
MINTRWIICFDLESDNKKPDVANPVQLAATPIDPRTLEIKRDEAFNIWIKPPGIDDIDTYLTDDRRDCIYNFHAKNYEITGEEVIEKWKQGVNEKIAMQQFCDYLKKYTVRKKKGQWYPQPIPAGINITDYDIPIIKRVCKTHKIKYPFSEVNKLDLLHELFWWWENLSEPADYKMDTVRKYMGIPKQGIAHDALVDTWEEGMLVVRFLQFHRKQATVKKFKNSFAVKETV